MDFRSLRYFAEAASSESFSRAAEKLGRTQPALSRCIQDFEAELGFKLFERVGRRASITAHGQTLLSHIEIILNEVEALKEKARLIAAGRMSVLRVGSTINLIERIFPEILRRYKTQWPHVEVSLKPDGASTLLESVEKAEIDIAVTRHAGGQFLVGRKAFPTYLIAALPTEHPLAKAKFLTIKDLNGERLLAAPASSASRIMLQAACQAAQVRPWIVFENHELSALVALAAVGQGVAIIPSIADTRRFDVKVLPIMNNGTPLVSWTSLIWDGRRQLPVYAEDFIRLAITHLKSHYPGRDLQMRGSKKQ